jgi:hypothetical protein
LIPDLMNGVVLQYGARYDISPLDLAILADAGVPIAPPVPAATIRGRHIFYNNSKFDGRSVAAGPADDAAIAPDKLALLPGGTASLANYTSFSKGINGIMIDMDHLAGTLTPDDFSFRVGNSNNPRQWKHLDARPTVTVRSGAGEGGADRVELTWTDGAITKQWLQVTVKAGEATGLEFDDVFYFGNALGEAGNAPGNALVSAIDEIEARNDPHGVLNPATILNRHDYTRDGLVNAADQIAARNNGTTLVNALKLISVPAVKAAAAAVPEPPALMLAGLACAVLFAKRAAVYLARCAGSFVGYDARTARTAE